MKDTKDIKYDLCRCSWSPVDAVVFIQYIESNLVYRVSSISLSLFEDLTTSLELSFHDSRCNIYRTL